MASARPEIWSGLAVLDDVRRVLDAEAHRLEALRQAGDAPPRRRFLSSLRSKIVALVLVAVALPMVASAAFVYQSFTASAERTAASSAVELTNAVAVGFDRFVDSLERYTMLPVTDRRVLEVLQNHAGGEDRVLLSMAEREVLGSAFLPALLETDALQGLRLYTMDGWRYRVHATPDAFTIWRDETNEWMSIAAEADGALVFVTPDGAHAEDRIGLARLVREPLTHRPLGYVLAEIGIADVEQLAAPVGGGSVIELIDRDGRTFFSSAPALTATGATTVTATAPSRRFSAIATIPLHALQGDAAALTQRWILVGAAALLAVGVGAGLLARRMMRPVGELHETMRLVAAGETTRRAKVRSRDEVGMLSVSLNSMLDQIDELIGDLRGMAARERDAAILALQGQMNPHFLFNSLEMVNMLAVQRREWEISDAIARVGRLFRHMIDVRSTEVSLAEELGFVSNWVDVYAANRDAGVELAIAVPAEHMSIMIPKFMLQPLVENAMLHTGPDGARLVSITSAVVGGQLVVTVTNPISTPSAEHVQRLNRQLQEGPSGERHRGEGAGGHGLPNVHHRLQLHHGPAAGLTISGDEGRFVVEARLPFAPNLDHAGTITARPMEPMT